MRKMRVLTWLIWGLIVATMALLWWSAGRAQGVEEKVYLPVVMKFPPSPRPVEISAKVYNAIGQELKNGDVVWNELHIRVDAIGCSSVYPGFMGVDRVVQDPTYYHLECSMPDMGYIGQTTGADVIVYLNSPMWWSGFAITVYYPNGMLETVLIKGPWWWLP